MPMKNLVASALMFILFLPANAQVQQILVARDQAIILTPQEETLMKMFDGNTTTTWFPGWGAMYPASFLLDLKHTYTITKIRVRNYQGQRVFKIYGGSDPFSLNVLVDQNFSNYDSWYDLTMNVPNIAYLKFEITQLKTESPAEVELYGIKTANSSEEPGTGTFRAPQNINGVLGVNTFHWVDPSLETPFLHLREYTDVEWIQPEDEKYRYNPSWRGNGMFDEHYHQLKDLGVEVLPCLQGNLPWTRTAEYNEKDFKPVYPVTADPLQPSSYAKQAAFHFQFAARYGSTVVDESLLLIDPTPRWNMDPPNVKKTGLGLVKYFECWNEPDKGWKGVNGYMNPFEFAAYMSAVTDGHCKTMGTTVGIKNADPNAKVVMGGLAALNIDYVKGMVLWFKKYRPDHSVPIDVFNFHHYSNSAGAQHTSGSVGISPEQDQIREKLKKIKEYIDTNLPGKEIFFSEYGYDSNTGSIQRCEPIGSMSRTQVQGVWNVREMLEIMASQVDRSYVYMMYDESDTENTSAVFGNCGMLSGWTIGSAKKPSWYYINTLKEVLKDNQFIADESPNSSIRKYKFKKGNLTTYALWLTSSTDASASYTLSLPNKNSAALVALQDNNASGTTTMLNFANEVTFTISEKPVFVVVDENQVLANHPHTRSLFSVTAFPNPSKEILTLHFTSPLSNAEVEVTDLLGKVCLATRANGTSLEIPTEANDLKPGIYMIRIQDEKYGINMVKIVKE